MFACFSSSPPPPSPKPPLKTKGMVGSQEKGKGWRSRREMERKKHHRRWTHGIGEKGAILTPLNASLPPSPRQRGGATGSDVHRFVKEAERNQAPFLSMLSVSDGRIKRRRRRRSRRGKREMGKNEAAALLLVWSCGAFATGAEPGQLPFPH